MFGPTVFMHRYKYYLNKGDKGDWKCTKHLRIIMRQELKFLPKISTVSYVSKHRHNCVYIPSETRKFGEKHCVSEKYGLMCNT